MAIDDCELTELLKPLLLKVERAWLFEAGVKVSGLAGALLTGLHRNDIRKDPQWFLAQLRKLNEYQRQPVRP